MRQRMCAKYKNLRSSTTKLEGSFFSKRSRSHVICLCTFLWEHSFIPNLLCLRIKNRPLPIQLTVVFELKHIPADKDFCRPDKLVHDLLLVFLQSYIRRIWSIADHDKQYKNWILVTAWRFAIVGKILEYETFVKCTE